MRNSLQVLLVLFVLALLSFTYADHSEKGSVFTLSDEGATETSDTIIQLDTNIVVDTVISMDTMITVDSILIEDSSYLIDSIMNIDTVVSYDTSELLTKLTCVTYLEDVQPLINSYCGNCHGGYKTYSGLKAIVDNGKFEDRVLVQKDMPTNRTLSQEELTLLQCWIDDNAPESDSTDIVYDTSTVVDTVNLYNEYYTYDTTVIDEDTLIVSMDTTITNDTTYSIDSIISSDTIFEMDDSFCDSYDLGVDRIISAECATSGCHESGSAFGDFTKDDVLKNYVDNGTFTLRVFTNKDMPPVYAGDTLSASQLDSIECWLEQGANFPDLTYIEELDMPSVVWSDVYLFTETQYSIEVYNLSGQLLWSAQNSSRLDFGNIQNGVLIIVVQNSSKDAKQVKKVYLSK